MTLQNKIIYVDGTEEEIVGKVDIGKIMLSLGADCLDVVNLYDGFVMVVDDNGIAKDLPANRKATELYHGVCRPGTCARIYGPVAVILDNIFGG